MNKELIIPDRVYVDKKALYNWLDNISREKPFDSPDDRCFKNFKNNLTLLAEHWGYKGSWAYFKSQTALKEIDIESSTELTIEEALELHPAVTDEKYIKILKDILASKDNLFIQGKAGSGKSTMISILSKILNKVKICTPTGTAAINLMDMGVPARTIHSTFGIMVAPIAQYRDETRAFSNYHGTIIIDEISMVDCHILDLIMKKNPAARWILFGDMMQLQPVVTMDNEVIKDFWNDEYGGIYTWLNSNEVKKRKFKYIELESVYRQSGGEFVELLNKVRDESITQEELYTINSKVMTLENFESRHKVFTHLVQTNAEARRINEFRYNENSNKEIQFFRQSKNIPDPDSYAPEVVALKIGCRVMCLHNVKGYEIPECGIDEYDQIIVSNGNIGEVVDIYESMGIQKVKCNFNGRDLTIEPHTFEVYNSVKVDTFEQIPCNIRESKKNYISLKNGSWIYNEVIGTVTQLMLGVCYAITIHKCQGLTLNAAYMSFTYPCEGSIYIALSRVRKLEDIGLRRPIYKNWIVAPKMHIPFIEQLERFKINE